MRTIRVTRSSAARSSAIRSRRQRARVNGQPRHAMPVPAEGHHADPIDRAVLVGDPPRERARRLDVARSPRRPAACEYERSSPCTPDRSHRDDPADRRRRAGASPPAPPAPSPHCRGSGRPGPGPGTGGATRPRAAARAARPAPGPRPCRSRQRLDDLALLDQRLDALDPVVVGLDLGRVAGAARLDRVGVDRPLPQQPLLVAQPQPGELVLLHG